MMEPSDVSGVIGILDLFLAAVVLMTVEADAFALQIEEIITSLVDKAGCTEQ